MDNQTPSGETPVTTPVVPVVETVEELKAKLVIAEQEKKAAEDAALLANRNIEIGRKFEKFEDFKTEVLGGIKDLGDKLTAKEKEIEDLKSIISNKSAYTPNVSSTPNTPPAPTEVVTAELEKINSIFGTKVK